MEVVVEEEMEEAIKIRHNDDNKTIAMHFTFWSGYLIAFQITEYILQRHPLHKVTREDAWPVSTPLTTKLYSCKQAVEKTTSFISRAALIV